MFEEIKNTLISKEEKKVEYIELIYDLIFVYMIGRNSNLVHTIHDGFIDPHFFMIYVFGTLIIIQIWNFSNFYINRYGSNGIQEHIMLLINMFLLYFMGDATTTDWVDYYYYKYNIAWMLILLNFLVNYLIKYLQYHKTKPWEALQMIFSMIMFSGEILIILISLPIYAYTRVIIAPYAVFFGIIFTICTSKINNLVPVDFGHLTERAMLYVVFTFGEMIIAISGYFEGEVTPSNVYFALMGFLIVVGLFQSYEICYDHLIDRGLITNGSGYMMIHLFLIFAMNNITAALEFMREDEVALLPKIIFLTGSFIFYFVFLYLLGIYAKRKAKPTKTFIITQIISLMGFSVLMIVFRENMHLNIALTVLLVFENLYIIMKANRDYIKACSK